MVAHLVQPQQVLENAPVTVEEECVLAASVVPQLSWSASSVHRSADTRFMMVHKAFGTHQLPICFLEPRREKGIYKNRETTRMKKSRIKNSNVGNLNCKS